MFSESVIAVSEAIYADLLREAERERLLAKAAPCRQRSARPPRIPLRLSLGRLFVPRSVSPVVCCPQPCC
jgi:hypothetical protein